MGTISGHQLSTFASPVNGTTPIDANTVRGNDNTIKTAYNAHDADTTIHVQNGLVASRPAASTAGQMWLAADTGAVYAYYDTGSAWVEWNYLRNTGGTVSGALSVTGDFAVNTSKFTVAASTGNALVAGTLGVTGVASFTAGLSVNGGVATGTPGSVYTTATLGMVVFGAVGSVNDLTLTNKNGSTVMSVATGTQVGTFAGGIDLTGAPPTAAASHVALGGSTRTTIGANGGATALTALPLGYVDINVGGTIAQIPYYSRGA